MRMNLARLEILILKVHITAFAIIMALMQIKYGLMGIGFIQHHTVILVMVKAYLKVTTRQPYKMDNYQI